MTELNKMKPMNCKTFFNLNIGDKVYVIYHKNGNPEYERLHNTTTVVHKENDEIGLQEKNDDYMWEFYKSQVHNWDSNYMGDNDEIQLYFPF